MAFFLQQCRLKKKTAVLTNIYNFLSVSCLGHCRSLFSLKSETWYETCETHNVAFYLLVLADTGEMAEEDEPLSCLLSVTWSMQKNSFGRFLLASLVAAHSSPNPLLADTALSQFETCLTWFFSFAASLLILVPLVFLKWDTSAWWCSVLTASQMLLFGNCSMAAFAFLSHFGLRAKVWWTWDFWCLSTPDFCMLSTPSMIAWLHKIRSIFAC